MVALREKSIRRLIDFQRSRSRRDERAKVKPRTIVRVQSFARDKKREGNTSSTRPIDSR